MENDFNLKAVELDNFFEGSSPVFKLRVCPFPEMSSLDFKRIGLVKNLMFGVDDPDRAIMAFLAPLYDAVVYAEHSLNCGLNIFSNDSFFARLVLFKLFVPRYMGGSDYKDIEYSECWIHQEDLPKNMRSVFWELTRQR
jgi:hypothetical protein